MKKKKICYRLSCCLCCFCLVVGFSINSFGATEQYIGSIGGVFGLPEKKQDTVAGISVNKWYMISSTYEEGIAVRSGPSTEEKLLTRIPYGTLFFVDVKDGVWGHTTVNDYTGWIHLDYAKQINTTDTETDIGWYRISYEDEDGIAVRTGPSTEEELLIRIPYGTRFYVDTVDGIWGRTTVNGYTGWVHLDYAKKINSPDTETDIGWYSISYKDADGIAVRIGPSTEEEMLIRIPYGTRFYVDAVSGIWGHTTVNGYTGWVHLDYADAVR